MGACKQRRPADEAGAAAPAAAPLAAPAASSPAPTASSAVPAVAIGGGVALVCAANVLLPLQDAIAKDYVQVLPVWQVLFIRSLTVLALALAIGRGALVRRVAAARRVPLTVARALVNLAAWGSFYLALRDLPLAQAITLYFVSPVIVALLAGPVLGEKAAPAQWLGIALGLGGVALASGAADVTVSVAAGFGLLAAALWAVTMIMLRAVATDQSALTQVVVANAVFVVVTGAVALGAGWRADPVQTAWIALAGVAGGAGQYAIYAAAQRLSATALGALEYGALVSGFVLGWLFFAEVPSLSVCAGAALVVASGLLVVAAERRRAAAAALPLDPVAPALLPAPHPSRTPKEIRLTDDVHDKVAQYIARTRFPFPGQQDWPAGYVTICNAGDPTRAIDGPDGPHHPDIIIVSPTDVVREVGEVEMTVDPARVPHLRAGSEASDDKTPTKVRHFFVYVPAGLEADAQALLDEAGISYAGVRGFTVDGEAIRVVPFVTKGDQYDHQITEPGTV